MIKTVIMINVGTPESPEVRDVGIYLKEFLMDENILQIPRPFRDLLVKGVIVPFRKYSSSAKYKKIWTSEGSPLLKYSRGQQRKLQASLGPQWNVLLAMQVGEPRLAEILGKAQGEIFLLPLYPQFATATTGGALQVSRKILRKTPARFVGPFYDKSWFIKAQAQKIREKLRPQDHLLLSYHGLPISHLKNENPTCGETNCCNQSACERKCYKAQCLKTSELLKKELGLQNISVSFQSRLGRAKWIEPSTLATVENLAGEGVKHLKVACPSFVADCLETLEEVGMEIRQTFLNAGGESFELIECVNDSDLFIEGLTQALYDSSKFL